MAARPFEGSLTLEHLTMSKLEATYPGRFAILDHQAKKSPTSQ
jgi:hypothetical protein